MKRNLFAILYVCVLVVFIAGCSSAPITVSLAPTSAMVFSGQSTQLTATDSTGAADVVWAVMGSGNGSVDANGNYTAPSVTQTTTVTVTATSKRNSMKTASSTITVLPTGVVTTTNNPQVAQYTLTLPTGTNAFIQFGTDTTYTLHSWTQPASASGTLSIYVAGMLANTEYHMRAALPGSGGAVSYDADHTFTTKAIPTADLPALTVTTTSGATPQSGVEMLNLLDAPYPVDVVDLSGNLLWAMPSLGPNTVEGVHLLPNGHFLVNAALDVLAEVDLGGNIIQQETIAQLEASLTQAGYNYNVQMFHHDVIALPNGHWIALINILVPCAQIPNCTGVTTEANIRGDVLVDLAPTGNKTFTLAWVWSTFDHLDITRALQGYPDWTHSNAILYSPADGDLLLSIRHQSWIIKIDYNNGSGTGKIVWHLGYQGDFTLMGGTDPTDWFYAQHGPSYPTTTTTGQYQLAVMDNGNLRTFPAGVTCGTAGEPACGYSAAKIFQLDESAMTATLQYSYEPGEFSGWGGEAQVLANGNMEGDFNAGAPKALSDIYEVTVGGTPQVVWHLRTAASNAYRGFRMGSMYPGVQW